MLKFCKVKLNNKPIVSDDCIVIWMDFPKIVWADSDFNIIKIIYLRQKSSQQFKIFERIHRRYHFKYRYNYGSQSWLAESIWRQIWNDQSNSV